MADVSVGGGCTSARKDIRAAQRVIEWMGKGESTLDAFVDSVSGDLMRPDRTYASRFCRSIVARCVNPGNGPPCLEQSSHTSSTSPVDSEYL